MSMLIRRAAQSDIPYFYTICLQTGDYGKDATTLYYDPWLIGQIFSAPYLFHDISLCFVVEVDGTPKGYVIGTENTLRFNQWLETDWFPQLRRRYSESAHEAKSEAEKRLIATLVKPEKIENDCWLSTYPAHLHIDLLPEIQGKGCGRNLIETLISALRNRGCPGVHLGVSGVNTNAIAFYSRLGFSILEKKEWGLVMGKAIS